VRDLDALHALGFTEIEALVYAFLLRESPATGYRVSHAIGRQTANTYKAIASLAGKGAIVVDDGGSRLCRAVPPEEVLQGLERRFQADRARALRALQGIAQASGDDRVYQLRSAPQALERARAMLERARALVLLDVFPGPCDALRESIVGATGRARVIAKVYGDADLPGVTTVRAADAERVLAAWPGQQLSLVVDAEEHLLALFAADMASVHQAVCSNSTFLSCMQHNHLASELLVTAPASGLDPSAVRLTTANVPGFATLSERYGPRPLPAQAAQSRRGSRTAASRSPSTSASRPESKSRRRRS